MEGTIQPRGPQAAFHPNHQLTPQTPPAPILASPSEIPSFCIPPAQVGARCLPCSKLRIPPWRRETAAKLLLRTSRSPPPSSPFANLDIFCVRNIKWRPQGRNPLFPKMAEGEAGFARRSMSTLCCWMSRSRAVGGESSSPAPQAQSRKRDPNQPLLGHSSCPL